MSSPDSLTHAEVKWLLSALEVIHNFREDRDLPLTEAPGAIKEKLGIIERRLRPIRDQLVYDITRRSDRIIEISIPERRAYIGINDDLAKRGHALLGGREQDIKVSRLSGAEAARRGHPVGVAVWECSAQTKEEKIADAALKSMTKNQLIAMMTQFMTSED